MPVVAGAQQSARAPLSINPSTAAPDPSVYISAQDIADRMTKADAAMKSGGPSDGRFPLLTQPPFEITLEYHSHPAGEVVVDEPNAELYIVLNGSGTMSLGGKLVEPKRTAGMLT